MLLVRTILASLVLVQELSRARYVGQHDSRDISFENEYVPQLHFQDKTKMQLAGVRSLPICSPGSRLRVVATVPVVVNSTVLVGVHAHLRLSPNATFSTL
jgi:hypothetical protein